MITDIDVNGLNFIRGQEGRALRAYQDPVGVWTIGYGITNYDKGIGFVVKSGATITAEQAEWLLYRSLRLNYLPAVERVIDQSKVAHPQGAINGGASMHYNTGGILRSSWPKLLNAGNLAAAKMNFESWDRAGGRVLGDLVRRRALEWQIITEERYPGMTGPEIENERGHGVGHASLLTALPTDPAAAPPTPAAEIAAAETPTPAPGELIEGITGPAVIATQVALVKAGIPAVPQTGVFDKDTKIAVTAFQTAHSQLGVDGTVGPATKAALTRACDLRAKAANLAKAAVGVPAAAVGAWRMLSPATGEIILAAGAIGVAAAVIALIYHYRNEVGAMINHSIGRTTP
jgi:lysozyme